MYRNTCKYVHCELISCNTVEEKKKKNQVPPRLELGSLDSKSSVFTFTPWDLCLGGGKNTFVFLSVPHLQSFLLTKW